mmetsp:Transcript_10817/g.26454  ORF Transcript_10817/g.26454 Transcript_10817/m.26454 type:complete len:418 (-) Transcript_10817:274-1527(-)
MPSRPNAVKRIMSIQAKLTWKYLAVLLVMIVVIQVSKTTSASKPSSKMTVKLAPVVDAGSLRFISLGDFGVTECGLRGFHRKCDGRIQRSVADCMDNVAMRVKPDFILSLGDNFYPDGAQSLDDNQFSSSFEHVYNRPHLKSTKWWITIGDHDHCGNVTAMLAYAKGERGMNWLGPDNPESMPADYFRLPAPYYHRRYKIEGGKILHLVVTDSVALEGAVGEMHERRFSKKISKEYAGAPAARRHWLWLERIFQKINDSIEPKIVTVVGHRPVFSAAQRRRTAAEVLVSRRLHTLLSQMGVDLYIHGHDHVMQHIVKDRVQYIGNGVGGFDLHKFDPKKPWPEELVSPEDVKWGTPLGHGFAVHEVTSSGMQISFHHVGTGPDVPDEEGNIISKDSLSTMVHKLEIPFSDSGFLSSR